MGVQHTDHGDYESWSVGDGKVSSYTVKEAEHSVIGQLAEVDEIVLAFLQRGTTTSSSSSSTSSSSSSSTSSSGANSPTATPCNDACATAFTKCYNLKGYDACRSELNEGRGALAAKCEKGC